MLTSEAAFTSAMVMHMIPAGGFDVLSLPGGWAEDGVEPAVSIRAPDVYHLLFYFCSLICIFRG